ncbi:TAT-variant-translocated molybdopterin oxidoreductase [Rhodopila sp.]|uniref:TAT-variant-translocated molybdopterin oxidoreductase n=1 Tax=Rhodopila sp. TaxID=2480087 RepID=UPI003D12A070
MSDPYDLAALRARLAGPVRRTWRSLDAVADTPEFRRFLHNEFPSAAGLAAGSDRRGFLKLMAASLALAGLAGCDDDDPRDQEVPYVRAPEQVVPSATLSYASAALIDGFANGVLVTTRNGRPIKIEGNPQHPWTRGGTDVFGQASILDLYDPLRSQAVQYLGRASTWLAARAALVGRFAQSRAEQGNGLRLLTGPVTSPSLIAQIDAMRQAFPRMRWHSHMPADRSPAYAATQQVFGRALETRWHFDQAKLVVALDGDFLDPGPHQVGVSRDWIEARQASARNGSLLQLHTAAMVPNLTSAKSDYHVAVGPRDMEQLARSLLSTVSGQQQTVPAGPIREWQSRVAAALQAAHGQCIVIAGATQPAAVQAAVHGLNVALGNVGKTVFYTAPVLAQAESLTALAADIDRGDVRTLVMLDTNPAYDAPADLRFIDLFAKVPLKIHAGLYVNETANYADWHLPLAHPLETWGDARALDGTVSVIQPTIQPFYGSRSMQEILSLLIDQTAANGLTLLRGHYQQDTDAATFEPRWRQALLDGFLPNTALPAEDVRVNAVPKAGAPEAVAPDARAPAPPPNSPPKGLDVIFRPDPTIWDGSLANNGWLQELPKPLTKLVWENAISIAPALAERAHLSQGDIVTLAVAGRSVEGPVWVLPGQADNTVALTLGYGRPAPDLLFSGLGYDAYAVRISASPWQLPGGTLHAVGRRVQLATTQIHNTMEGHDFARVQPMGAAPVGDPANAVQPTLYPDNSQHGDGRAWAMVIDNDACIGCNACVVACQAENNIAVVGKEQVLAGRAMHWLRIDRYYEGGLDDPDTHFMPIPCMHCEQAPCEVGCPVEATLHDSEGLNLQVYNRCIGTRACSSYCPYKVRHFNYLDYTGGQAPSIQARNNPDVTVRSRGVMEKCTYCVQRIAAARITADKDNAPIPDGAVQTACQGACPTRAITFGDKNNPRSAVAALRTDPRHYALLGELNVRPRTTYLAEWAPPTAKPEG